MIFHYFLKKNIKCDDYFYNYFNLIDEKNNIKLSTILARICFLPCKKNYVL